MYNGNKISVHPIGNNIIELCFDANDGSVNIFNQATVDELHQALTIIEQSDNIGGMLVTSAKSVFIVGADITEFTPVFAQPANEMKRYFGVNNSNFNRIEDLPFPTVVAINGFALGGGLELCLACDYRVMASNTKVGLPETGLGIIPGWGGTVRAPRLMGIDNAMAWMATARHYRANDALQAGLISRVTEADSLRATSISILYNAIRNPEGYLENRKTKTHPIDISSVDLTALATAAKAQYCTRAPHLHAPSAAIDLLVNAAGANRTQALALESDVFITLTKSEQARALIGNFINEQTTGRIAKNFARQSTLSIHQSAVVGAGIMGGGIAYQNALKQIPVVMKDINDHALDLGMEEANKLLTKKVRQGRMSQQELSDTLGLITPSLDNTAINNTDLIIEAVIESPTIKESVLAEFENNLSDKGILVSNTSTISISRLANALQQPQRFAGMHFFNPVHAMPLVEIIRGEHTSDATIADAVAYSLAIGKKPIVVNDCPAFLVNRVLFPYFRAFELLIRDGADFNAVDKAMEDWGWPMGPAYLSDVCGIDTIHHCQEVLATDLPDRMSLVTPSVMDALYQQQRYGQKNAAGFYRYQTDAKGRPQRTPDSAAATLIKSCQSQQQDHNDEDIVIRCMLPMAIEMARCIEEGIVSSPAEADMALLYGLGFPPFRGGILRWMDEIGAPTLCQWSERFAYLGNAYCATDGMKAMASTSSTYY